MHTVISAFFGMGASTSRSDNTPTIAHCFQESNDADEYDTANEKGKHSRQVFFFFDDCDDTQCQNVIARVIKELCDGNNLTLNMCGHGRGGLAVLMVAKQLSHMDDSHLSINLVLLDPVPGNSINTAYLDPFEISLTNKLKDLTACKPLKKVLALYSVYKQVYAPLFPSYPAKTVVDEEVLPISHKDLVSHDLSLLRVSEFFYQNGVPCDCIWNGKKTLPSDLSNEEEVKAKYLALYQEMLGKFKGVKEATREAHSERGLCIKIKNTEEKKKFFVNEHHRSFFKTLESNEVKCLIAPDTALIPSFKRLIAAYPVAWQILKWACLGLGIASLIHLTGGFGMIPLFAPVLSKLASLIIVAAAPIVAAVLAVLWYGIAKPSTFFIVSSIVYPDYAMPNNPSVKKLDPERAKPSRANSPPPKHSDGAPVFWSREWYRPNLKIPHSVRDDMNHSF